MKAKDLMSKQLFCCTPADSIQTAAKLMKGNNVGAIAVVNDCTHRIFAGVITDRDICMKVVAERKASTTSVRDAMSTKIFACKPDDSLESCEQLMSLNQVRRIPVISSSGECWA